MADQKCSSYAERYVVRSVFGTVIIVLEVLELTQPL